MGLYDELRALADGNSYGELIEKLKKAAEKGEYSLWIDSGEVYFNDIKRLQEEDDRIEAQFHKEGVDADFDCWEISWG